MNLMSSSVTVFLPACAAALIAFLASTSAEASTASALHLQLLRYVQLVQLVFHSHFHLHTSI